MARSRRSSAPSPSRTALLDAAESLMIEEGYAAVTSRKVAARAGVNNGLIHYYFGTMDDMFIELFRREADRTFEPIADSPASDQPLWEMWQLLRDFSGNALMTEFIALSNHRDAIRSEIADYSERVRTIQVDVVTTVLSREGIDLGDDSPLAITLVLVGMSRYLQMEAAFGFDVGHDDVVQAIERRISRIEGERRTSR